MVRKLASTMHNLFSARETEELKQLADLVDIISI